MDPDIKTGFYIQRKLRFIKVENQKMTNFNILTYQWLNAGRRKGVGLREKGFSSKRLKIVTLMHANQLEVMAKIEYVGKTKLSR